MKASYKRRWIKALKSGQYELHQDEGMFRVDDTYNIMAVLYDINLHEINLTWRVNNIVYGQKYWYLGLPGDFFIEINLFWDNIELSYEDRVSISEEGVPTMNSEEAAHWIEDNL